MSSWNLVLNWVEHEKGPELGRNLPFTELLVHRQIDSTENTTSSTILYIFILQQLPFFIYIVEMYRTHFFYLQF